MVNKIVPKENLFIIEPPKGKLLIEFGKSGFSVHGFNPAFKTLDYLILMNSLRPMMLKIMKEHCE